MAAFYTDEIITKDDCTYFIQECVFLSHGMRIQTFLKSQQSALLRIPGSKAFLDPGSNPELSDIFLD